MKKYENKTFQRGFTIVELLIVIVVIAILTAITVVSYNGITHRANSSVITTHMRHWEKLFESYIIEKGRPPMANWRCLGDEKTLPAENGYAVNFCFKPTNLTAGGGTGTTAPADPVLMQQLMEANPGSTLPGARFPEAEGFTMASDEGTKVRIFRGVFYDGSTNNFADNPAIIAYYVKRSACPIGERVDWWSQNTDVNTSACVIKLSVNEHGQARGECNTGKTSTDPYYNSYRVLDTSGNTTRYCYRGSIVTF